MIEILDFELRADTGSQSVAVSAEPQAIYFVSKIQSGTDPQKHEHNSYGFWTRGTGGDLQCSQGYFWPDLSVSTSVHHRCNTDGFLVVEDNTAAFVKCAMSSVSATQITFNVTGSLNAAGVRVVALAISGIEDAWCGVYNYQTYPILFNSGFQPDVAFFSQTAAQPNDVVRATPSGALNFGLMNATNQASVSVYSDSSSPSGSGQAASNEDISYWIDRTSLIEQFYGIFGPTGMEVKARSGRETTTTWHTMMTMLLKGVESTIVTGTTPAGSTDLNFTHTPEAMIVVGTGSLLWNTLDRVPDTASWGQHSQALATPGATPITASLHSGRSSLAQRDAHRNNKDGACWGIEAGVVQNLWTDHYRGEIAVFDGQAGRIDWTEDGTGAPTASYPWFLMALNADAGPDIPLNTATIDAVIDDVPLIAPPPTVARGGYPPFGVGVFR